MEFNKLFKNWDFKHTEEYQRLWDTKVEESADAYSLFSVIFNHISEEESPLDSLANTKQWIDFTKTKTHNPSNSSVYNKIKTIDPKKLLSQNFSLRCYFKKYNFFTPNEDFGYCVIKGIENNIIFLNELAKNKKKYKIKTGHNTVGILKEFDMIMKQKNIEEIIKFIKKNPKIKFDFPIDMTLYCDRETSNQWFRFLDNLEKS